MSTSQRPPTRPPAPRRTLARAVAVAVLAGATLATLGATGAAAPVATPAAPVRVQGEGAPAARAEAPGSALDRVARAAELVAPGGTVLPDGTGRPAGTTVPGGQDVRTPDVGYRLPVAGGRLRARFDPPPQRWAAGHRGVDLDADVGAVVVAPAAGTVEVAGRVVDREVVTLRHDDGRRTSLEPVVADVAVGTRVAAGAPVGRVEGPPARSHCAAPCVHWGVREGEEYVDPLDLLAGAGPVVLLPSAR